MQLERNVDVSNKTKTMAQCRVGLYHRTRKYYKKYLTLKRTKHSINFSFKIFNDFLEVRGFSSDFLTLARNELSGILDFCLFIRVDSQHKN